MHVPPHCPDLPARLRACRTVGEFWEACVLDMEGFEPDEDVVVVQYYDGDTRCLWPCHNHTPRDHRLPWVIAHESPRYCGFTRVLSAVLDYDRDVTATVLAAITHTPGKTLDSKGLLACLAHDGHGVMDERLDILLKRGLFHTRNLTITAEDLAFGPPIPLHPH